MIVKMNQRIVQIFRRGRHRVWRRLGAGWNGQMPHIARQPFFEFARMRTGAETMVKHGRCHSDDETRERDDDQEQRGSAFHVLFG